MRFENFNNDISPQPTEPEKPKESAPNHLEKGEAFRLNTLAESVKRIGICLAKREADGLNSLIDRSGVGAFFSVSSGIEEFLSGNKDTIAELQETIPKLNFAFEQFGKVPPERMVREDTESLKYLNHTLLGFADEAMSLKSFLGSKGKEEYAGIILGLNRSIELSEKVSIWLRKKADLLEGRGRY